MAKTPNSLWMALDWKEPIPTKWLVHAIKKVGENAVVRDDWSTGSDTILVIVMPPDDAGRAWRSLGEKLDNVLGYATDLHWDSEEFWVRFGADSGLPGTGEKWLNLDDAEVYVEGLIAADELFREPKCAEREDFKANVEKAKAILAKAEA